MMDVQQFEQEILKLAFETNTRITAASVAYYLGIPSRETTRLLNQLLEDGVVELDSDEHGNLFYLVPHQHVISAALADKAELEDQAGASREPACQEHLAMFATTADDDGSQEAISPHTYRPPESNGIDGFFGHSVSVDSEPAAHTSLRSSFVAQGNGSGAKGEAISHAVAVKTAPHEASSSQGSRRARHVLIGATSQEHADTDAWVGDYFASPMIVQTTARCEPKPLPNSRPTIVACVDPEEEQHLHVMNVQAAQEQEWWAHQGTPGSGAMVLANGQNMPMPLDYMEQPEHQPGMALLLSLILCGTGQIYNGEVSKGIMMMVLCFMLWFLLLGWVVHIWSIVDAVVVAERINRKQHA